MFDIIFFAVGFVFVLEGMMPFLSPMLWRRAMQQMIVQSDKTIRIFGLCSMLIGLFIVYLVHYSLS